jgi:hypothetical protein
VPTTSKKVEIIPDGMVSKESVRKNLTDHFKSIETVDKFKKDMDVFLGESGLSDSQRKYKSVLMTSILAMFDKKFKVFALKKILASGAEKNRIIGFELIQLAISLESERMIKDILTLQATGIFSAISGLSYESLKAEVLSDEKQKEEILEAARLAREKAEKNASVQDEISALQSALISMKLHSLPTKELEATIEGLKSSMA